MLTSFDMRSAIVRHPYLAVAAAAMAGAAFACAERSRSVLLRATVVTISGVLFSLVRERAAVELEQWAKSWLDQRNHPATEPYAKA